MCFGLDILGTGRAAKRAAAAAEKEAAQTRLIAAGTQQATEAAIAQQKATTTAQELLATPAETTSVSLSAPAEDLGTDATGKRKTARAKFQMSAPAGSGIAL